MRTNQINFYLLPNDWDLVERYVQEKELMLLASPSPIEQLRIVSSVNPISSSEFVIHKYYIALKSDEEKIIRKFIANQNYYTIDETNSPVVELLIPFYENYLNRLNRGRFYYSKEIYFEKTFTPKDDKFLNMANDLFKWFRKTFKTPKLEGYEDFIISPAVLRFHKNGGALSLNPEVSKSVFDAEKIYHPLAS